jgi:hypothetical protein
MMPATRLCRGSIFRSTAIGILAKPGGFIALDANT